MALADLEATKAKGRELTLATRVSPVAKAMAKALKARTMALADPDWEAPQVILNYIIDSSGSGPNRM